jgi:hypothetical protein
MVKRYPHIGTITYKAPGTYDANRKFTEGATITKNITCREYPSGGGQFVTMSDGSKKEVSSKIHSPLFAETIPDIANIAINGKTRLILRVFKFQNYVSIWV